MENHSFLSGGAHLADDVDVAPAVLLGLHQEVDTVVTGRFPLQGHVPGRSLQSRLVRRCVPTDRKGRRGENQSVHFVRSIPRAFGIHFGDCVSPPLASHEDKFLAERHQPVHWRCALVQSGDDFLGDGDAVAVRVFGQERKSRYDLFPAEEHVEDGKHPDGKRGDYGLCDEFAIKNRPIKLLGTTFVSSRDPASVVNEVARPVSDEQ